MKLGLIAMSGVRAHDAELTKLGLTLPGFVERNRIIAALPSLGLLTLAGMTPPQIDVQYLEVDDLACVDGLPGEFDAVAISSFSAQIGEGYALADRYRAAGIKVLLGGLHVTACPDEAARHGDSIVLGDGESCWPELIGDLQRGRLKPRYDGRGAPFDLARSPMPRFDLLDPARYNRITLQTQRGCPFNCEFCAASIRLAPLYRVKPVETVLAEIRRIKEIWPNPFLEFADDNSFVNKARSKQLLRAIAGEHVRWFTESDISIAADDELLSLMRDAGCVQVLIGLESASAAGVAGIELKSDWKARQFDFYLQAVRNIQLHGISVNGCFVLGLDGDDEGCFQRVLEFVQLSGLHEVQVTVQTPFPNTPLYERLLREGRILHEGAWELCTLFDVNFRPLNMDATELERRFNELVRELYSRENTLRRRRGFNRQLREFRKTSLSHGGSNATR